MKTEKLQMRLALISRANEKISYLEDACVFTTDLEALQILQEMVKELQETISENLKLSKEIQINKTLGPKNKRRYQ
tara:strand:- start:558 stop:785 length:228 start_codon:yes stop_codon:yes gene_type:complete